MTLSRPPFLATTLFSLRPHGRRLALGLLAFAAAATSNAAPLTLAEIPAGTGQSEPPPNVFLSVDDSGSMIVKDTGASKSRINLLKDAVLGAFDKPENEGKFRLGFQAMTRCPGFSNDLLRDNENHNPDKGWSATRVDCPDSRVMKFDNAHRGRLRTWMNSLIAHTGGTPAHSMMWNVHKYLSTTTGIWSPFAKDPGVIETPKLACRRSYHIFMTDGGWKDTNWPYTLDAEQYPVWNADGYMTYSDNNYGLPGNADGTKLKNPDGTLQNNLPDGTPWDPSQPYARVYADNYSSVSNDARTREPYALHGTVSSLADWTFWMWATDYRSATHAEQLANQITPIIREPGIKEFTWDSSKYNLPEYWNPRNNPMTWQGVTTYTVGFGDASEMNKNRRTWVQYTGAPANLECTAAQARLLWTVPVPNGVTTEQITTLAWGGNWYSGDLVAMIAGAPVVPRLAWPDPLRSWPPRCTQHGINKDNTQEDGYYWSNFDSLMITGTYGNPIAALSNALPNDDTWQYNYGEDGTKTLKANWQVPAATNTPSLDRILELWHAGVNGRGGFYPAVDGNALKAAFDDILNQVIADKIVPVVSVAANTQTIQSGTKVYTAGYEATKNWSGYLKSWTLDSDFKMTTTDQWDAATKLDAIKDVDVSSRQIFTGLSVYNLFLWSSLTAGQKAAILGTDTNEDVGRARIDYLRGDRRLEAQPDIFRTRSSRLGDIANSSLWVVGKPELGYASNNYAQFRIDNATRPTMIYVGANDGMLHGFAADDGTEKFAYVPVGVYPKLREYSLPTYTHRYFVDGSPYTGDFYNGSAWRTALVGTLGAGGKGYFVLDVTSPKVDTSSGSTLVMLDKTDLTDLTDLDAQDIGHILAEPTLDANNSARVVQITKLNNGRWAVVMGNGVNSTNEKAVLLIQYLDGQKELLRIVLDTTPRQGNGLANPQLIDINGDGTADVAYAGDLLGNFWRVDLTSSDPAIWQIATRHRKLFVAMDGDNKRQPITTAPQWAAHPNGGIMLAFGTGREMTFDDRTSTDQQTLYAIWDNSTFGVGVTPSITGGSSVANRSNLVKVTQDEVSTSHNGKDFYKTSLAAYTGASPSRGWYFDWPVSGERTVNNGGMISSRFLRIRSRTPGWGAQDDPTNGGCDRNYKLANEYLTVLNIITGLPPSWSVFVGVGEGNRVNLGGQYLLGKGSDGVGKWNVVGGGVEGVKDPDCLPGSLTCNKCRDGDPNCNLLQLNVPQDLTGFGWRKLQ